MLCPYAFRRITPPLPKYLIMRGADSANSTAVNHVGAARTAESDLPAEPVFFGRRSPLLGLLTLTHVASPEKSETLVRHEREHSHPYEGLVVERQGGQSPSEDQYRYVVFEGKLFVSCTRPYAFRRITSSPVSARKLPPYTARKDACACSCG
jgi:hypothetical protein